MLFNKEQNGTTELQELTGSYYANNDWARVAPFVKIAEEEMIGLLGQALYDQVDELYNPSGSGSAAGGLPGNSDLLDIYRMPIAYKAAFNLYQANLVSHADEGRVVNLDTSSQKMAWEWMIDRDDMTQLSLIHKTTDRLIKYLDKNSVATWISSASRTASRSLFVNNTSIFNDIYPIDNSPAFYYSVLPFIKEIQRKHIKPALGGIYSEQLVAWQQSNLEVEGSAGSGSGGGGLPGALDMEIIERIHSCMPLLVMILAVKRKSIQALPAGVVQQFSSMITSKNASQAAPEEVKKAWIMSMQKDASEALDELKNYVAELTADPIERIIIPKNSSDNGFFRT